tara:strand:+ start:264 stop:956 length:693 start_codon:yes stop_codon:yes gene_type:complete
MSENKELKREFPYYSSIYMAMKDCWVTTGDRYLKIGESQNPEQRADAFKSQIEVGGYKEAWSLVNVVGLEKHSTHYQILEKCAINYFSRWQCLARTKRKWSKAQNRMVSGISSEVFKNVPWQTLCKGMAAIAVCQKFDILALCDGDMSKVIDTFKNIAENELTKEDLIIQYQKIELYKKLVKKGDQGLSPLRALRVRDYKVMSTVTFMGERTGRSFESGQINYGSTITKQ